MTGSKDSTKEGNFIETNPNSPTQAVGDAQEAFFTPSSHTSACRKVSFAPLMRLVLIPCVRDYRKAKLIDTLWWKASDFFAFQQQAHSEIRQTAAYDSSSHRDARRKLYQPSGDELALPRHIETSVIAKEEEDDDIIEVVSSYAEPLALRTMHRSVSFDNLSRLKAQREEAISTSKTTIVGALARSNSCSSIGSGSRIRSQSLSPPVLTESCVRRIFRTNSMDKLQAQGQLKRNLTMPTPEAASPADGDEQQQLPRENVAGPDDDLLCVHGPDVELRDSPSSRRRNSSFFGILSKAVDRDVLARVVAWTSALTIAVLLASATTPGSGHSHL